MQFTTLQELSFDEVDQISDAGFFSLVSDVTVDVVKVSNDLLNMSVISSVGRVFNTVGLIPIYQPADTLGYGASKGVAVVGGLLDGSASRIGHHYDTEWT